MSKLLTTEQFIEKAQLKHGNKYNYSKVVYKSAVDKVIITCPKHGDFIQTPASHLYGRGCKKCGYDTVKTKNSLTQEDFLRLAKQVHGDKYDYSSVQYASAKDKIKILCKRCNNYFYQSAHNHLSGQGCTKCAKELNGIKSRKSQELFIQNARLKHGDLYDYSRVNYITSHIPVEIVCKKHGPFWQKPIKHIQGGQGCPKCRLSTGESKIYTLLKQSKINFIQQYKFADCKDKAPLPFDFAVLNKNGSVKFLIEYQGIQHFEPRSGFGGNKSFTILKLHDLIKKNYCSDNKFPLYYITYKDDIMQKLKEILECSIK